MTVSLFVSLGPSVRSAGAQASRCFTVVGSSAPAARRGSDALAVTFSSRVRLDAACRYSLAGSRGPFTELSAEREVDFAQLVRSLRATSGARGAADSHPLAIYGCAGTACDQTHPSPDRVVESIYLASCASHLISGGDRFVTLQVNTASRQLEVSTHASNDCGADATVLRFAPVGRDDADVTCEAAACGDRQVALGRDASSAFSVTQDLAVFAAREGSPVGMRIGSIRVGNPLTALRIAWERARAPWFRAAFERGRIRLVRTGDLGEGSDAWQELRVAASAGQLWLTRRAPSGGQPAMIEGAAWVDDDGEALVLSDSVVQSVLRARYGAAASAVTPDLGEVRRALDATHVCVPARYEQGAQRSASAPTTIPPDARCARLGAVVAPLHLVEGTSNGQVCFHRAIRHVTSGGARPSSTGTERCVTLGIGAGDSSEVARYEIIAVGDALELRGTTASTFMCVENHCTPLRAGAASRVSNQGLVEIRFAADAASASSAQAITLARIVAVDPANDWHPVGLQTTRPSGEPQRWRGIDRDDTDTFAYTRRRQTLRFQLGLTPAAVALMSRPAQAVSSGAPQGSLESDVARISQDVQVVSRFERPLASPGAPIFVALATERPTCPTMNAEAFRRDHVVDPDSLTIDQRFYVYLARYRADDEPFDCIARAAFRVRPARVLAPIQNAGFFQLGLLGDLQAQLFFDEQPAFGVSLPIASLFVRIPVPDTRWFHWGVDLSAVGTVGVSLVDASFSRTGIGMSAALSLGVGPVSRLLSVGVLLQPVYLQNTHRDASGATVFNHDAVSGFVGLNLGSLFDLAGGR